jgi:thiol-disulfide isomerase/thioredoxin
MSRMDQPPRMAAMLLCVAALWTSCSAPERVERAGLTPVTAADILKSVRSPGASAVLVNLWATWCDPCREEFPDLMRLARKYRSRGLRVLLVSADHRDDAAAVERFLSDQGVDFPTYLKVEKDQPFIDSLEKRWTGALPATLLFDGRGRQRGFWEGPVAMGELEKEIVEVLGDSASF